MHKSMKALLIGLIAVLATAFAANIASAIEITPAGAITKTSVGLITFRSEFANIECRYSLRGTLERTVANRAGSRVGSITSGSANECRGGTWTLLVTGGAWPITVAREAVLEARGGTLDLTTSNFQVQFELLGNICLYTGTLSEQLRINVEARGALVTEQLQITGSNVRRTSGSIFCPSTGTFAGTFGLAPQQTLVLP